MISNKEIARIFAEFSKILELKAGDKFKILAFEKAARSIESHGESIKQVYDRAGTRGLDAIEGIGESIAAKIEEFIKTGKVIELERLKKGLPKGEIELLDVPGIGPKTARKIYKKYKIKDIADLERKLKKDSEYFKEKTRSNILRGVKILQHRTGRMLLSNAREIAFEIVDFLKKDRNAKNITPVGSLRRWSETVGDIDVVLSSSNPKLTIDHFTKFRKFTKILAKGEAKSSAIYESAVQVDLEILPQDQFGSLLQHFTGSKDHNVALRTFAKLKKMSISEHGIKMVKTGKLVKCESESQVYKTLGMDYIEPELREDRGEIEAALKNQLPDLVELKDIKGDLHIHSDYSDGKLSIEQIAQKAINFGYEYVAICDHTIGLGIAGGLSIDGFKKRQKEIERIDKKYAKIKILSSCEVNIKADGTLDIPDDFLKKLDVVTASVHTSFSQDKDRLTDRIIKAVSNPNVDILGHPTGRMIGVRESYDVSWQEVFAACKKYNTALEINAQPVRLDLPDSLIVEARKYGLKFAISTDSHTAEQMDYLIYGVSVARRGWCEKKEILNSQRTITLIKR